MNERLYAHTIEVSEEERARLKEVLLEAFAGIANAWEIEETGGKLRVKLDDEEGAILIKLMFAE
ncbi:hypothetical protein [Shumkonia mesophila]|uniref:hypothetical protein n=1 Tax=Shumkonia mesophila TaxID=2838854 RepID=UPI002934BAB6|nr:hypothetical protein [Shumkonia mesophila]